MKQLLLLITLLLGVHALAQSDSTRQHRPMRIVVGSSLTYIWDTEIQFKEYTWSLNAAINPIRNLYLGINLLNIWNDGRTYPLTHSRLAGVFAQYRLSKHQKVGFYPELGYYRGNYCTCGELDPFQKRNLQYLSIGGGFGWKIYRGLELETAFFVYHILNRIPVGKYGYTQYVIGLNYAFALPRLRHAPQREI